MTLGRIVGLLVLVAVLYAIITAPATAAGLVRNGAGHLADAGSGVVTFMNEVVSPGSTGASDSTHYYPTGGVATGDGSYAH